jgi:hypothetical protein
VVSTTYGPAMNVMPAFAGTTILERIQKLGFAADPYGEQFVGYTIIGGDLYLTSDKGGQISLVGRALKVIADNKFESALFRAANRWMYGQKALYYVPTDASTVIRQHRGAQSFIRSERLARNKPPAEIPISERLQAYKAKKRQEEQKARWRAERIRLEEIAARCDARQAAAWPMNKQRRSNVDWLSLVPERVAHEQMLWERCATAAEMRRAGLTYKRIGECLGVTGGRARQLTARAEHDAAFLSPVEEYCSQPAMDVKPSRRQKHAIRPFIAAMATGRSPARDWMIV